ncbi:MAG: ABC transporter ATP-binding protein [Candidatus Saganbacteria bacterium]|nr:ABC transporter ATP-binding protein [Candidatus Saganbacteria bacterium]
MEILKIENLWLEVEGKQLLKGLNLVVHEGEKTVLLGPNGSGKSTLLYTLMGFPNYKPKSGKIIFKGQDITNLPMHERVKLGMGLAFQNPPAIRGIKLSEMLQVCRKDISVEETATIAKLLNMEGFLDRDVNLNFSGGEAKRAELLQILAQKPEFVMFDEPDSGVDIENVELIGKQIEAFLSNHSGIVITHQGYILNFIKAARACILYDGNIICSGNPLDILEDIRVRGYEQCVKCNLRKRDE